MTDGVLCSCHRQTPRALACAPRSYACARARDFDIPPWLLLSAARNASLVKIRTTIAKELREAGLSLPEIGRALNRHHTSILHLLTEAT